jgi:putative DNA primase/helicase
LIERDDPRLSEIRDRLRQYARAVVERLFGDFLVGDDGKTLKFGRNKGSLHVEVSGPKQGKWYDFAEERGSDVFDLIKFTKDFSDEETNTFAANLLDEIVAGRPTLAPEPVHDTANITKPSRLDRDEIEIARRIEFARNIWRGREPLCDTVGEHYLNSRGIIQPADGWPKFVAFSPETHVSFDDENPGGWVPRRTVKCAGAVLLAAAGADGKVYGIQRIYLGSGGANIRDSRGNKIKITNGAPKNNNAVVRLPGDNQKPLMLAEGPETGLSIWTATGCETWIALGGMNHHEPPTGRPVIACRDDDAQQSPADKSFNRAIARWRRAGVDIRIATPWSERRFDKSDFNDVLIRSGAEEVRNRIDMAIDPRPVGERQIRLPIEKARTKTTEVIADFFNAVDDYERKQEVMLAASRSEFIANVRRSAPAHLHAVLDQRLNMDSRRRKGPPLINRHRGIQATSLSGPGVMGWKFMRSEDWASLQSAAIESAAHRAAIGALGSPPIHAIGVATSVGKSSAARRAIAVRLTEMRGRGDNRNIVIAVPTARLGHEQVSLFMAVPEAAGLTARVRLGRERPDPQAPGETMCRDLNAVREAQAVLADPQRTVCRGKNREGEWKECRFLNVCGYQRQRSQTADVWFAAHETLFLKTPKEIDDVAFLVVDESPWRAGLIGANGSDIELSVQTIRQECAIPDLPVESAHLRSLRDRLAAMLETHPDGPLTREALLAAGITSELAADGNRLEWKRKVDAGLHPGMAAELRREVMNAASVNKEVRKLTGLWKAIEALARDDGPVASGWIELAMAKTDVGSVRVLRLKGRKEIADGWRSPTLLMDATLQLDLIRPYWPDVKQTADVLVETPHQRLTQVMDRSYSKSHMKSENHICDVHAIICREARRRQPGRVLAVLQKQTEHSVLERENLPSNLTTAHHNAVAGRDEWNDVAQLIVVGRTAPSPRAVERIAEALTGEAVPPIEGWYPRVDALYEMIDGSFRFAQSDRHPHPVAESIRWRAAEGELLQIAGRARGANRTADNPVNILVMCDMPLPVPVAHLISAADLAPSPRDRMFAAGGVLLEQPADAARAYPELWPSADAARKAFKRSEVADIPVLGSTYTRMSATSPLRHIHYRLAGRGRRPARAVVDTDLVSDARAWLTDRLGALSMFEVVGAVGVPQADRDWAAVCTSPSRRARRCGPGSSAKRI